MKILYDLLCTQPAGDSKFHGGGEYGKIIFKRLIELNKGDNKIEIFFNKDKFIDDWILEIIRNNNIKVYDIKSEYYLNELLKREKYNVFYSALPINYPNLIKIKETKYIGTIHGLRSIELPYDIIRDKYIDKINIKLKNIIIKFINNNIFLKEKYIKLKINKIRNIFNKLDLVITVSEHTKFSMLYYLGSNSQEKIKVLYTPQKYVDLKDINFDNKYGDYVLLISADRWLKNAKRAIDALDSLYDKEIINHKCIIVGKLPKRINKEIRNKNKFIQLDYVSTNELEVLYKNAELFIYPTLNEGFGMPPLEAMKYNTKVVASAITSITEILKDSALYFNPYDKNEIAVRIIQGICKSKSDEIKHYFKILERQQKDLDNACRLIIGEIK